MIIVNVVFCSQGDICWHCQHLLLLDARPVEGECVQQVSLPGVHRLPGQEPHSSSCRSAWRGRGRQALLKGLYSAGLVELCMPGLLLQGTLCIKGQCSSSDIRNGSWNYWTLQCRTRHVYIWANEYLQKLVCSVGISQVEGGFSRLFCSYCDVTHTLGNSHEVKIATKEPIAKDTDMTPWERRRSVT